MPQEGVSRGPSLRKKLIDAARRLSKSALSLQVRAGRRDPIALGIENRDPITVVALVVKCKLVSVVAMCAGCHRTAAANFRRLLSCELSARVRIGEGTTFENENWAASRDTAISPGQCPLYPPKSGH